MAEEVCYEEDQISLLPDAVLCHILSFLPTKYAVGSSVLSKRWRYVWTSVPVIEISDYVLLSAADRNRRKTLEVKDKFMDFVDRVLCLNEVSCLQKFCLSYGVHYDLSRVSKWISTLFMRDIEKLELNFPEECSTKEMDLVELPLGIFTCKKLETLKLCGHIFLNVFPAVYLPSLKIIHLDVGESLDQDSVKNLLAGCPVLEELEINRDYDEIKTLFVQSSSLKRFSVCTANKGYNGTDISVILDTINLEQIDLDIIMPQQFEANSLSSLSRVKLALCNCFPGSIGMDAYGNRIVEILRKMSNTKHLFLSMEAMDALGYACLDKLHMFPNLTHLEVEIYYWGWPILPYFLECSPNLAYFLLSKAINFDDDRACECHQQFRTPNCLMLYLEKIEIKDFEGQDDEMEMISYFLKKSPLLKKVSITYHKSLSLKQKSKVQNELMMLSKGSTGFETEFSKEDFVMQYGVQISTT